MDEYINYSMPIDDNDNVCDNVCPIAATGIQNNFIPTENDFVTPEQEINIIDKCVFCPFSRDFWLLALERLCELRKHCHYHLLALNSQHIHPLGSFH